MINKSAPKISIITPSLNQGKYIERAIQSILGQEYPNLEYVIIDGGSKDNSVKIIKKYADKLTYWVSEPDRGQSDAINKGFARTSGEIMTWLNSDDILMPGTLNLAANIFKKLKDVQWISGIPTVINEEGLIVHLGLNPAYIRKLIELGFHHGAALGWIMQEGTFWRRQLWEKAGGGLEEIPYSMDYLLWRKFAKYAELVPVYTSLAAYRLNPNRRNVTSDGYFKEIGLSHPKLLRYLMLPVRFFVHFILRRTFLSAKIFYNTNKNKWIFHKSWVGSGKEVPIYNRPLGM